MSRTRLWRLGAALAAVVLLAGACTDDDDDAASDTTRDTIDLIQEGGRLQAVRDEGTLVCGVNNTVPGFGFTDAQGNFSGFDIDYCRAIAAGVLGDPDAVEFRPLTAQQRFTALQSGEIDVLVRNTTWTSSRDGGEGATFLTTTYYDGQGMMVRADSGIDSIEDMDGTTVCVLSGTTTELNLATAAAAAGIDIEPLSFEENPQLQEAFIAGRCEGWTSDRSQLAANRANFPETAGGPESLVILDEVFSKEPLGPAVQDGDSEWAQVVDWIVISTIQAEEYGLTQQNVAGFETDNPDILRFLGRPFPPDNEVLDPGLGLDPDFVVDVISAVGNYGEIYNRHLPAIGLEERGLNNLYTQGGLLYAPPYR